MITTIRQYKLLLEKNENEIILNVWDDYKHKPEYDVTDDTYIYVEEYSDLFNTEMRNDIIEFVLGQLQVQDFKFDEVSFSLSARNHGGEIGKDINVSNLNDPQGLSEALNALDLSYNGKKIRFISES